MCSITTTLRINPASRKKGILSLASRMSSTIKKMKIMRTINKIRTVPIIDLSEVLIALHSGNLKNKALTSSPLPVTSNNPLNSTYSLQIQPKIIPTYSITTTKTQTPTNNNYPATKWYPQKTGINNNCQNQSLNKIKNNSPHLKKISKPIHINNIHPNQTNHSKLSRTQKRRMTMIISSTRPSRSTNQTQN